MALARDRARYGAEVLLVTPDEVAETAMEVIRVPALRPLLGPALEILCVQLLVAHLCGLWELPVDGFRHPQPDTRLP